MLFLGSFSDEVMAARSYDKAAKAIHKGNAKLNFPEEEDQLQGGEMQIVRNVRGGRQQRQEQQQNVDASASASGSSSRSRGGGGSELDSSSSSSSIEVHLGRRLEYRFIAKGVSSWCGGVVKKSTSWAGWYQVAFDDGQCTTVKITAEGQGTAWRWSGRHGTDLDASAAAVASAGNNSKAGRSTHTCVASSSSEEEEEEEEENSDDDEDSDLSDGGGGSDSVRGGECHGSERLSTSTFASVRCDTPILS